MTVIASNMKNITIDAVEEQLHKKMEEIDTKILEHAKRGEYHLVMHIDSTLDRDKLEWYYKQKGFDTFNPFGDRRLHINWGR